MIIIYCIHCYFNYSFFSNFMRNFYWQPISSVNLTDFSTAFLYILANRTEKFVNISLSSEWWILIIIQNVWMCHLILLLLFEKLVKFTEKNVTKTCFFISIFFSFNLFFISIKHNCWNYQETKKNFYFTKIRSKI